MNIHGQAPRSMLYEVACYCRAPRATVPSKHTVKLPTYLPDLRGSPSHETEVALRAPAGRAYTSDIGHDWLVTD